mmetsp:Transcript_26449/g.47461  ORF Transcript_26449/g.47461 Transcript_26449/m.47461 type:complete len:110 (-) Transcript_26449:28-357(-)
MSTDNIVRVGVRGNFGFYAAEAKKRLRAHENVELHGVGEAITNTIRAGEVLVTNGYTSLDRLETTSIEEPNQYGVTIKRSKVIVVLRKTSDFARLDEEFEKKRTAQASS